MKNITFLQSAQHGGHIRKATRNLLVVIGLGLLAMVISRQFYGEYTDEYMYVKSGNRVTLGWPASIFRIAAFTVFAFALFLAYIRYKQDLKNPALGVTENGLFINQQLLRNRFVPWENIERAELRGHASNPVLRVFFKDVDALLKGQFFLLRSISKATLKTDPSLGISKSEAAGDLVAMFDLMQQKGVAVRDNMAGRAKPDLR